MGIAVKMRETSGWWLRSSCERAQEGGLRSRVREDHAAAAQGGLCGAYHGEDLDAGPEKLEESSHLMEECKRSRNVGCHRVLIVWKLGTVQKPIEKLGFWGRNGSEEGPDGRFLGGVGHRGRLRGGREAGLRLDRRRGLRHARALPAEGVQRGAGGGHTILVFDIDATLFKHGI